MYWSKSLVGELEMSPFPLGAGKGREIHFVVMAIGILDDVIAVVVDLWRSKGGPPPTADQGPVVKYKGGFHHIGPGEIGIGRGSLDNGDLIDTDSSQRIVQHKIRIGEPGHQWTLGPIIGEYPTQIEVPLILGGFHRNGGPGSKADSGKVIRGILGHCDFRKGSG